MKDKEINSEEFKKNFQNGEKIIFNIESPFSEITTPPGAIFFAHHWARPTSQETTGTVYICRPGNEKYMFDFDLYSFQHVNESKKIINIKKDEIEYHHINEIPKFIKESEIPNKIKVKILTQKIKYHTKNLLKLVGSKIKNQSINKWSGLQTILLFGTLMSAIYIGFKQNNINENLLGISSLEARPFIHTEPEFHIFPENFFILKMTNKNKVPADILYFEEQMVFINKENTIISEIGVKTKSINHLTLYEEQSSSIPFEINKKPLESLFYDFFQNKIKIETGVCIQYKSIDKNDKRKWQINQIWTLNNNINEKNEGQAILGLSEEIEIKNNDINRCQLEKLIKDAKFY